MSRSTLLALALTAALGAACRDAVSPPSGRMNPPPSLSEALKTWQCLADQGASVTKGAPGSDGADAAATIAAREGEVITRVAVKAGSDCWRVPAGTTGAYTIDVAGSACFLVEGLGTAAVTVTRVGASPECKNITHVEYVTGPALASGLLQVCAVIMYLEGDAILIAQPYTFTVAGTTLSLGEAGTYPPPLMCADPLELPAGEYAITQSPWYAHAVHHVHTVPADRLVAEDPTVGTATVLVVGGSTTVVTFESLYQRDPLP